MNPNDRQYVLAAVTNNGDSLYYASPELQADREVVLAAVTNNGYALKYASPELKADRVVVMAAVSQDGYALKYASPELKADRVVVMLAVINYDSALYFASPELKADREFILAAVINEGLALGYASPELRSDREVVLTAVTNSGDALISASPELKADRVVVMAAVSQDGYALQYASPELRSDREVVLAAVNNNGEALRYASPELKAELTDKSTNEIRILLQQERQNRQNPQLGQFRERLRRGEIQTPEPRLSREQRRQIYQEKERQFDDMSQNIRQGIQLQDRQQQQVNEITSSLEAQIRQIREKNRLGLRNPKLELVKRRLNLYNKNQIPNEFICPITQDIMEDPVIIDDGHTFERTAIQQSFLISGFKSPITRAEVSNRLIPNIALRNRIQDWMQGYSEDMQGGAFDF